MKLTRPISAVILAVLFASTLFAATASPGAKDSEVTGVHRGYTNDELFVRLDNDKEMTFTVRIAGDKDWKWHKAFEINDRITVTYHTEAGEKRPVATAIRKATPPK